jgi:hypothetical protein
VWREKHQNTKWRTKTQKTNAQFSKVMMPHSYVKIIIIINKLASTFMPKNSMIFKNRFYYNMTIKYKNETTVASKISLDKLEQV